MRSTAKLVEESTRQTDDVLRVHAADTKRRSLESAKIREHLIGLVGQLRDQADNVYTAVNIEKRGIGWLAGRADLWTEEDLAELRELSSKIYEVTNAAALEIVRLMRQPLAMQLVIARLDRSAGSPYDELSRDRLGADLSRARDLLLQISQEARTVMPGE